MYSVLLPFLYNTYFFRKREDLDDADQRNLRGQREM